MPSGATNLPKVMDMHTIQYIQHVIKDTVTPSWINSVPSNYGENAAGTIKADEWRTLSTVYLPIALVTLWGDDSAVNNPNSYMCRVLDHTMALFQAVMLVCQYTMNVRRMTAYRNLMKKWIDSLFDIHPHARKHHLRPNVHASFHLYDFLLSFGPVIHWWCFPFERLIGTLQQINMNEKVGGVCFPPCLTKSSPSPERRVLRCNGINNCTIFHASRESLTMAEEIRLPRSHLTIQASLGQVVYSCR
jgi:hypothetical protein